MILIISFPTILTNPYKLTNKQKYYASTKNIKNNAEATYVLFQPDLTTCIPHRQSPSADIASRILGGSIDTEGNVLMPDRTWNRVTILLGGSPLTGNALPADLVLGQINFTASEYGSGNNEFKGPADVTYDPNTDSIWVADAGKAKQRRVF